MNGLTVVILTFNEEVHLARAIESIASVAERIIVIDSFSSDRTVQIARDAGAVVLQNEFVNQAKQFEWAMSHAPIDTDWIMRIDADEYIDRDLADRLREQLPLLNTQVTGVNLKRKHIFMGRWIRHGGRYPLLMLRIFRRGKGVIEDRWMDEHITVKEGKVVTIDGGFFDHNLRDLNYFIDKHNRYATREAIEVIFSRKHMCEGRSRLARNAAPLQAVVKRFVKERIFNRLPFEISALCYFVMRYVFQLGFLDGRAGLVYHFLQGFWYRFLVGAKVMELERGISHLRADKDVSAELSRLTGYRL